MAEKKDSRSDAVRSAVEQAFQATAGGTNTARDRAQDLVDELAQAAGRVREALDDLRPATSEEIRALRADLRRLEKRVSALEGKGRRAAPKRS